MTRSNALLEMKGDRAAARMVKQETRQDVRQRHLGNRILYGGIQHLLIERHRPEMPELA